MSSSPSLRSVVAPLFRPSPLPRSTQTRLLSFTSFRLAANLPARSAPPKYAPRPLPKRTMGEDRPHLEPAPTEEELIVLKVKTAAAEKRRAFKSLAILIAGALAITLVNEVSGDVYAYFFPPIPVGWTLLEEEHTKEWRIKGGVLSEDGRRILRGPYTPVEYDEPVTSENYRPTVRR